jgi:hypothetical protein
LFSRARAQIHSASDGDAEENKQSGEKGGARQAFLPTLRLFLPSPVYLPLSTVAPWRLPETPYRLAIAPAVQQRRNSAAPINVLFRLVLQEYYYVFVLHKM